MPRVAGCPLCKKTTSLLERLIELDNNEQIKILTPESHAEMADIINIAKKLLKTDTKQRR